MPLSQGDGGPGFGFVAHKVHIHRWPPDAPEWSPQRRREIGAANSGRGPRRVSVAGATLRVGGYLFGSIRRIGITVPLFKRQCTVIFEGRCEEFHAHVHITTKSSDYLETFNSLTRWRARFPDAYYLD